MSVYCDWMRWQVRPRNLSVLQQVDHVSRNMPDMTLRAAGVEGYKQPRNNNLAVSQVAWGYCCNSVMTWRPIPMDLCLYLFVYATGSRWLEINVCGRVRFLAYWLVVIGVFLILALKAGRVFRFRWFHWTAVLVKEFLCWLVLQGLISRLLLLFLV